MPTRRKFFGRARSAEPEQVEAATPRPSWVAPTVHTLLDMTPLPGVEESRTKQGPGGAVREWDLLGFGVLMTSDGVLHALDPVAYRTWQLRQQDRPVEEVALVLAAEWDVELDRARRGVTAVLSRLGDTVDAGADA